MFATHVAEASWLHQQRTWLAIVLLVGATIVTAMQMRTPARHRHPTTDERLRRQLAGAPPDVVDLGDGGGIGALAGAEEIDESEDYVTGRTADG